MNNTYKEISMADIAVEDNGIVDGPFGSNLKKSDYIEDSHNGIPVLTTKNLYGDYSSDSVRYISKEKYDTLKRSTVFPGDIIVAKIGSIGKCGIYPLDQGIALIPANLLKITVKDGVSRNYVFYYIQSRKFQDMIKSISTATAQPAFNVTKFRKLPIPVPSLEEQHRIVSRIDELFSQLDSGVETLKKTKEQLKVYRQAVLKEAFEGITETANMNEVADMIDPHPSHRTPPEVQGGIPYIGIGDIDYTANAINYDSARKVSNDILNEHKVRYNIQIGDFVMGKIGTIGKPFLLELPQNYALSANVILIQPNSDRIRPMFLYWQFTSPLITEQLKKGAKATSQPAFGIKKARVLKIKICSLSKQDQILEYIGEKISVCDSIEKTIDTALQEAEALRQSILKQAFEGGL